MSGFFNRSFIINDPNGELLAKFAYKLESISYNIKILNFANPCHSYTYNPFSYIHEDVDVFEMVETILKYTSPILKSNAHWMSAENDMLSALCLYLYYKAPFCEQNFSMIMELLRAAFGSESKQSDLDKLFKLLEDKNPNHIALQKYAAYKRTQDSYFSLPGNAAELSLRERLKEAGRHSDFVAASLYARLKLCDRRNIGAITIDDNIMLKKLQEEKTALFITYNHRYRELLFILSLLYKQSMRGYLSKDDCFLQSSLIPVNYVADYENPDALTELIIETYQTFKEINNETIGNILLLDRKSFIKNMRVKGKNADYDVTQISTPFDKLDAFFNEFK